MTTVRGKVTVCMTAYNGGKYIAAQIGSILPQLDPGDEIVLCDDASTDDTLTIVEGIGDSRIRILRGLVNRGVLATVDRCLREASGEIVFLSDQDDIWFEDKVARVLGIFQSRPDVTLVLSDAKVIDDRGEVLAPRYLGLREGTGPGWVRALRSIASNRYLGCAVAFRRTTLDYCLPIPPTVPMHDMWIGILSDIYGRSYYIGRPLMAYRRHGHNATLPRRGSLRQIVVWRYRLLRELAVRLGEVFRRGRRSPPHA